LKVKDFPTARKKKKNAKKIATNIQPGPMWRQHVAEVIRIRAL